MSSSPAPPAVIARMLRWASAIQGWSSTTRLRRSWVSKETGFRVTVRRKLQPPDAELPSSRAGCGNAAARVKGAKVGAVDRFDLTPEENPGKRRRPSPEPRTNSRSVLLKYTSLARRRYSAVPGCSTPSSTSFAPFGRRDKNCISRRSYWPWTENPARPLAHQRRQGRRTRRRQTQQHANSFENAGFALGIVANEKLRTRDDLDFELFETTKVPELDLREHGEVPA